MKKKLFWGSYTTKELSDLIKEDPVVILPVGAYEQHGHHLPLDTDTKIGFEIAKAAVEKVDVPCALLPSVWLGISEHHMHFSGTLTLRQATLKALVYDILQSLKRHGVNKFIILNSHGGNVALLNSAICEIGAELSVKPVSISYWNLVVDVIEKLRKSKLGGISPGGELETSLTLYLIPSDGRKKLLKENFVPGNKYWSADLLANNKIAVYKSFHELSHEGHIGDPQKATTEFGKAVFQAVVKELVNVIVTFSTEEL